MRESPTASVGPPRRDEFIFDKKKAVCMLHDIFFSSVDNFSTLSSLALLARNIMATEQGPYAGLPCETITKHEAGKMGRVKGLLAVRQSTSFIGSLVC